MPSSSFFLRSSATLISALSFFSTASAAPQPLVARQSTTTPSYTLGKQYSGSTFFDDFYFFPDNDPTHGFVTYGNKQYATNNGLIGFEGDYAVMKMDSTTNLGRGKNYWKNNEASYHSTNGVGRKSVRIEGQYQFTHGLVITDIGQMPSNICGTWPAFWTLGQAQWPTDGEIDIIEGANLQTGNWMAAHTKQTSNINNNRDVFSARIEAPDCQVRLESSSPNYTGCKFVDPDPATYSSYTGGVWAMQWTSDRVKIWYWPYGSVPSDVTNGTPKPGSTWGTPRSSFAPPENFNADNNFRNHHVIFDTTFCGDLGDAVWQSSGCAARTGYDACADYVANVPSAFSNAKWKVKYVKIYNENTATTTTSSSTTTSTTTKSTTTSSVTTTTSSVTTTSTTTISTTTTSASTTPSSTTTSVSTTPSSTTTSTSVTTTSSSKSSTTTSVSTSTSSVTTSSSSSASPTTTSVTTTSSSKSSSSSTVSSTTTSVTTTSSSASSSSSTSSPTTTSVTTTSSSKSSSSSTVSPTTTSVTTTSSSKSSSSSTVSPTTTSVTTTSSSKSSSSSTVSPTTTSVTTTSSSKSSSSSTVTPTTTTVTTTSSSKSSVTTSASSTSTSLTTTSSSKSSVTTTASSTSTSVTTTSDSKTTSSTTYTTYSTYSTSSSTSETSVSGTWTSSSTSSKPTGPEPTWTTSKEGYGSTWSAYWGTWTSTTTTTPAYDPKWGTWKSTTTSSYDPAWVTWKTTTSSSYDPWATWPVGEKPKTTQKGGGFYAGPPKGGDDGWYTKTVTDVVTVPCTTATGWETKTTIYVTVVPAETWKTWVDPATATATWAGGNYGGDNKVDASTTAGATWEPVGPKPTYPVVSITVQPKPVSAETWGTASVPVGASTTTWGTWGTASVPTGTAKTPAASTTTATAGEDWRGVKTFKGAASSVATNMNAMMVMLFAAAGAIFML